VPVWRILTQAGSSFDLLADVLKRLLRRIQEFPSLTLSFLCKQGIETSHEALTWKIRRRNLRQVPLVEQRQLQVLLSPASEMCILTL
jgi:hypothetical protein